MTSGPPTHIDMLSQLPPELHVRITDIIDYQAAPRLFQTNKYFHGLVDPQQWPLADKEAVIQQAQTWPKHNASSLRGNTNGMQYLDFENFGLACYECFRVRPIRNFALAQCTKKRAKRSHRDCTPGSRRFCLDCGIATKRYRHGCILRVAERVEYEIFRANGWVFCERAKIIVCGPYGKFKRHEFPEDSPLPISCKQCEVVWTTKYTRDMRMHHGDAYARCNQCDRYSLACRNDSRDVSPCIWCRGTLCDHCGARVSRWGQRWCGRQCSKQAYDDCERMRVLDAPAMPELEIMIREKREARREKDEMDVFEREHDVVDVLAVLSL